MDPELQKKIEEARAAGYTDEEINQYLATKDQPVPANEEPSRMAEVGGLAGAYTPDILGGVASGLATIGTGVAAYKYGPDIIRKGLETYNNMRGATPTYPPGSPVVSSAPGGAPGGSPGVKIPINQPPTQQTTSAGRPFSPQGQQFLEQRAQQAAAQAAQANPTAGNFIERMSNLAKTYGPVAERTAQTVGRVVAPVARVIGSAPVMGAQLLMHSGGLNANEDEELRKRRAMAPTITP